jgi:hypothetical protein
VDSAHVGRPPAAPSASGVGDLDTSCPPRQHPSDPAAFRRQGMASSTRISMRTHAASELERTRQARRTQVRRAMSSDVAVHLLDQRLGGVEARLAADALDEVQPQLAP